MTESDEHEDGRSGDGASVEEAKALRRAEKARAKAEAKAAKLAKKAAKAEAKSAAREKKAADKVASKLAKAEARAAKKAQERARRAEAKSLKAAAKEAKQAARAEAAARSISPVVAHASVVLEAAAELMRQGGDLPAAPEPEADAEPAEETVEAPEAETAPDPNPVPVEAEAEPETDAAPAEEVAGAPAAEPVPAAEPAPAGAAPEPGSTPEPDEEPSTTPEPDAAEEAAEALEAEPAPEAEAAPDPNPVPVEVEPEADPAEEPEPGAPPAESRAFVEATVDAAPSAESDGERPAEPGDEPASEPVEEPQPDGAPESEADAAEAEAPEEPQPEPDTAAEPEPGLEPESVPEPAPETPLLAAPPALGALAAGEEPAGYLAAPPVAPRIQAPSGSLVAASIDVGATSVHLLVGTVDGHRVAPLLDESVFLGLGDRVAVAGYLGEEVRGSLVAALEKYAAAARELGANVITIIGTEPMRRAEDAGLVVRDLEARADVALHILDHAEEGLLTLIGATGGSPVHGELLLVDIGGGSTEFVVVAAGGRPRALGIQLGAARLTRELVRSDPPSLAEIEALRREVARLVVDAPEASPTEIVAVGGTASNLLRLLPATAVDRSLTRRRIAVALAMLTVERSGEAATRHLIRPERARILPAGAIIVDAVLEKYRADRLRVSEAGIREGAILAAVRGGSAWRDRLAPLAKGWTEPS